MGQLSQAKLKVFFMKQDCSLNFRTDVLIKVIEETWIRKIKVNNDLSKRLFGFLLIAQTLKVNIFL